MPGPQPRKKAFSLSRYPGAVKAIERLARNPSPFEPSVLSWDHCDSQVYVEWFEVPTRAIGNVLGKDPAFDLAKRLLFGQDLLDHCLLTGDRPSSVTEQKFALDPTLRLHIPLEQVTGLGFGLRGRTDFTTLRFEWEDPLQTGDAYSTAALLSDILRGSPLNQALSEANSTRERLSNEFVTKRAELRHQPNPDLSPDMNKVLSSALHPDPTARITRFQELRSFYIKASRMMLTDAAT